MAHGVEAMIVSVCLPMENWQLQLAWVGPTPKFGCDSCATKWSDFVAYSLIWALGFFEERHPNNKKKNNNKMSSDMESKT